jgi:hypothetical protein
MRQGDVEAQRMDVLVPAYRRPARAGGDARNVGGFGFWR